jgi:hypothetical protein
MIRKHIYQDRKIPGIKKIDAYEGELIETKVKRITVNNEPIKDGAPLVYTEKKDGVLPQFNIRTDKWDLVLEKMEAGNKQKLLKAKGMEPKKTDTPTEPKEKEVPST